MEGQGKRLMSRKSVTLQLVISIPERMTFSLKYPRGTTFYCVLAVMIVTIWGSTFAATKVLILDGMSPLGIFIIRFFVAYLILLCLGRGPLWANNISDELKLALSGVLGGSLYYLLQNTALTLSQTTNVSFLLSFCPLITMLLAVVFFKDQHITRNMAIGLAVALTGVGFLIFSGQHELHLSPKGDLLALAAATTWALYSQLIRPLTGRYSSLFMTRKAFFYGWITALPLFLSDSWRTDLALLQRTEVLLNMAYLTVFATIVCYLVWNLIILHLGPVRCASFLYLDPFCAALFSLALMDERLTPALTVGLLLILSGVIVAQGHLRRKSQPKKAKEDKDMICEPLAPNTPLELCHLTTGYHLPKGDKVLAQDLSAQLRAGELTCLLGNNGVGKSTLLRTLAHFQPALQGEVKLLGEPLSRFNATRLARTLGVVLTDKVPTASLRAEELVAMGRMPFTGFWGGLSSSDQELIRRSMEQVGMLDFSRRRLATLSDGERQKLMIAKVLAQQTPIILLDEPIAFLDFPSKVEILTLLRRLAREEGKAVLLSIHDLELALQMADRLWVLQRDGSLCEGTPRDLASEGRLDFFFEAHDLHFDKDTLQYSLTKHF